MFKQKPKKISSSQNSLVKHFVKLRENKKYREHHRSLLISGFKLVREIAEISMPKKIIVEHLEDALEADEIYQANPEIFKKILNLPSPEPIAAEFSFPEQVSLQGKAPLLVLEAIQDPGNLGTLMRTALALGWGGVFFLPGCVDPFHDKAIRSSRGALFHLPWRSGEWEELIQLKEQNLLTVWVADMHGKPLPTIPPKKEILLILSNEAQGISKKASQFGEAISIPISDCSESLNVAIAGAILMYGLRK